MKGIITTIVIIGLIICFGFLIKTKLDQISSMNQLLDMKCKQAYYQELRIIEKAKILDLPFDEDMTSLRKICGNKLINQFTQK